MLSFCWLLESDTFRILYFMYKACNKSACLTLYILVAKTLKILKQILVYLVSLLHFTISNSKDIVSENFQEARKNGNRSVYYLFFISRLYSSCFSASKSWLLETRFGMERGISSLWTTGPGLTGCICGPY